MIKALTLALCFCIVANAWDRPARIIVDGEVARSSEHNPAHELPIPRVDLPPRARASTPLDNNHLGDLPSPRCDDSTSPPPPSSSQCGKGRGGSTSKSASLVDDMERIVNGTRTDEWKYPFIVNLKFLWNGWYPYHICGGAIYDKYNIITASHCIYQDYPEDLQVTLGDWNQYKTEDSDTTLDIEEVIWHESYNHPNQLDNDIAILKLATPLEWSDEIQPVCMPSSQVQGGEMCKVIGWGATEDTGDQDMLREVDLPILSRHDCTQSGWIPSYMLDPNAVCAGYAQGEKDSCQGDSGGPLFRVVNGLYELVGVVSWGFGCADPKSPGVYADVYKFKDWIKANAGEPRY